MTQEKRTIGKLSYGEIAKITQLYRQGEPVFNIINEYNVDLKTVIDLGRGGRATVYDFDGKALFSGYQIDCEEYCDKHPKIWGSVVSRAID